MDLRIVGVRSRRVPPVHHARTISSVRSDSEEATGLPVPMPSPDGATLSACHRGGVCRTYRGRADLLLGGTPATLHVHDVLASVIDEMNIALSGHFAINSHDRVIAAHMRR